MIDFDKNLFIFFAFIVNNEIISLYNYLSFVVLME